MSAPSSFLYGLTTSAYISCITKLGEERVERGDKQDLNCACCNRESPISRLTAAVCGHLVCQEKAEGGRCPVCGADTAFFPLYGDEELSRECSICYTAEPYERVFFKGCGHHLCSCCLLRLDQAGYEAGRSIACPFCRRLSRVRPLIERWVKAPQPAPVEATKKTTKRKRSRSPSPSKGSSKRPRQ